MRIAYLDCFAGISGDMFLGALLGAGVPLELLQEAAASLGLDARIELETVDRSGISSLKVHVLEGGKPAEGPVPHSHSHGSHSHHDHPHAEEAVPPHTHAQTDTGTHEHAHEHDAKHAHSHEHAHGEAPAHSHPHSHEHAPDHGHGHAHGAAAPHVHGRSLAVIRELIKASPLPAAVKARATRTFEVLGTSEAKIHNVPVDAIHFHEVGAVDAIVDIVAASAGIEYLAGDGPLEWFASPVNVGGGMVECAHGTFPVPAPATADLLRGMATYSAHIEKELVTPTGAAILRTLDPSFAAQPAMQVRAIGYGAGSRNPKGFPNVLRLSIGDSFVTPDAAESSVKSAPHRHEGQGVAVLETALDDSTPQVLAHVAELALGANALDVMLTPVIMKKGRPGTLMTVLCNPGDEEALTDLLLRETSTLGVRTRREQRTCLERSHIPVETPYGKVRVKTGTWAGEELNAAPEFEDCRAAAKEHGVPVKLVMLAALHAYREAQTVSR